MATALTNRIPAPQAPALPNVSPLRFLKESRADMLGFMERWAECGDVARLQNRFFTPHLLTAPAAVQHVLQDNHKNYVKEARSTRIFRLALGEGILLTEGDHWRTQRRIAQPAFHRQRLAAMAAAMTGGIAAMVERWATFARSGEPLDLYRETLGLALDVIGRCLVGNDLRPELDALSGAFTSTFDYFMHAVNQLVVTPRFIPTARNRRLRSAVRELDRITAQVIEHGRTHGQEGDLLSMLIGAHDGPSGTLPRTELRDNVVTFLGAGTETTAVALLWIWYLLSTHPDAERRVREEVCSVLGDRTPNFDDLPRLKYTRMVIDETLRLYPPAWTITRTAVADDEVTGFRIPAGAPVLMSPWITHRSSRYWENPLEFDPERFTPERAAGRPDYAYYPFGGGPRMCIGDRFSLMEQTLAVAMVAQRFSVRVIEDHPIVPDPVFTLRPSGGLRATLTRA
jgi:cytochrome P450